MFVPLSKASSALTISPFPSNSTVDVIHWLRFFILPSPAPNRQHRIYFLSKFVGIILLAGERLIFFRFCSIPVLPHLPHFVSFRLVSTLLFIILLIESLSSFSLATTSQLDSESNLFRFIICLHSFFIHSIIHLFFYSVIPPFVSPFRFTIHILFNSLLAIRQLRQLDLSAWKCLLTFLLSIVNLVYLLFHV